MVTGNDQRSLVLRFLLSVDSYSDLRKQIWMSVFPHAYQRHHAIRKCSITSRPSLHVKKMVTYDCLHSARCSHGVIHSFFDGHSLCRVPCVLVCLHGVVDQSKFRIIDRLQSAVSVGGFVCIASDCITLVHGHEWIPFWKSSLAAPCMGDIWMDVEDPNGSIWKSGLENVSSVVIRVRSLG